MYKKAIYTGFVLTSFVLVVAFQNCGRPFINLNFSEKPAELDVLSPTDHNPPVVITQAPIPNYKTELSNFGGSPFASPAENAIAFSRAFDDLKSHNGGTLFISPGEYHFGDIFSHKHVIEVSDLANVLISGYGAKFTLNTKFSPGMPVFFNFIDPSNVTLAGLSFYDFGTDLNVNWKGAVCISVDSTKATSKFKTIDILAENVVTFFRSMPQQQYLATEFDISGTVKDSYYGVNPNYTGRFSKANLKVANTRRAFISYGARDWDIKIEGKADGIALASNGFVELAPTGGFPCSNVNVYLNLSGNFQKYYGLIHFYHQGPLDENSKISDVKAVIKLENIGEVRKVFLFDHEYPGGVINSSTSRSFENISLSGEVIGLFSGEMISSPTTSTNSQNNISVSASLMKYVDQVNLQNYFHFIN